MQQEEDETPRLNTSIVNSKILNYDKSAEYIL